MKYIFDNKEIIEKMFSREFNKCIINPITKGEKELYQKMGFKDDEMIFMSRSM